MLYVQLVQPLLTVLASIVLIVVNVWPMWAYTSPEHAAALLGPAWNYKGLWANCMQFYDGQYNCEEMQSMLTEQVYIMVLRTFMCVATALSVIAIIVMPFGMECSKFFDNNLRRKRKIIRFCGVCVTSAGLLSCASYAWYTNVLVRTFFSLQDQDNLIRYEIGAALYLGFGGSFVHVCAGITCFMWPGPKDDAMEYDYKVPNNLKIINQTRKIDYV